MGIHSSLLLILTKWINTLTGLRSNTSYNVAFIELWGGQQEKEEIRTVELGNIVLEVE